MKRAICLCIFLSLARLTSADVFFHGKVINPFGIPIKNAIVAYNETNSATTNDSGEFFISGPQRVIDPSHARAVPRSVMGFAGWRLLVRGVINSPVELSISNALGRIVYSSIAAKSTVNEMAYNLAERGVFPAGFYILRLRVDSDLYRTTLVVQDGRISARPVQVEESTRRGLAKANASTRFHATATGYADRDFTFDRIFELGMELMMLYPGQAAPAPVAISDSQETDRLKYGAVYWGDENTPTTQFRNLERWANSYTQCYEKIPYDTLYTYNDFTFHYFNLNNSLINVSVSPEMGSRIIYMNDMTNGSSRQMFAVPGANSVMQCTKFSNLGGVKNCFPITENSTGAIDPTGNYGYRSGYFIQTHPDGAATVVMNMRFDYNQRQEDCGFLGKYGDRQLNTIVTIRPGASMMLVRYAADNTNPTPRHNAIWNDAIFPAIPRSNSTSTSWIFPTKYAINHCAYDGTNHVNYWDMTVNHVGSSGVGPVHSYFALYPQYGFAGCYYSLSGGDASHLRVADPSVAPGMKVYDDPSIPELWGSTNVLFEGFNGLTGAFQPVSLPLNYFMAKNLGRVTYANEQVAITATGTGTLTYKLMSPRPGIVTVYNYNQTTGPLLSDVRIGPDTVLSGTCQGGLRVVSKDGTILCNIALPLQYADNSAAYTAIRAMADSCGCNGTVAPANLDARFGSSYEKEEVGGPAGLITSLASILAAANVTASNNADALISMARAAYKTGGFAAVNMYLTALGANKPQDANYLRGLMNLELGAAADFSNTPIEGNYFRALQSIAAGNSSQAITYLDQLLAAKPDAIRPRILRMYLKNDLHDAAEVYKRVPGSMELWVALKELGATGAAERLATLVQQNQLAQIRADDFVKEIKQGIWRHERRYEYDRTWFEGVTLPAFPDTLKYKGAPGPIL
jgi:hypothetical protein